MLIPFGVFSAAGAGGGAAAGAYELISSTILTGSQASVTFDVSTYASTYKHLQIRAVARMSAALPGAVGSLRVNGHTGTNYAAHYLQGTGSAVQSSANTGYSYIQNIYAINAASDVTNAFTPIVIDALDAFSITKNKTFRALSGVPGNESRIRLGSGMYFNNTSAITSIEMISDNGGSFVSGSRFSIYGIKG